MNNSVDTSLSLAPGGQRQLDAIQMLSLAIAGMGVLVLFIAWSGFTIGSSAITLALALSLMSLGTLAYAWRSYYGHPAGIQNNGIWFDKLTNRGALGWLTAVILTGFYILLYFFAPSLGMSADGESNSGLVAIFDPLSQFIKQKPASQWFVYGTLYTFAILIMGFKFLLKYRHNTYQIVRTISVMFFQLGFAFLIPEILESLTTEQAYFGKDLKNMWPLNYYFFEDWNLNAMLDGGNLGMFMLLWGLALIFIVSPVLTYFYGKRWYCSWVCGCGGLAETAGDPFRQLSDKSIKAWKIERWLIHSILVLVIIVTIAVIFSYLKNTGDHKLWISNGSLTIIVALLSALFIGIFFWQKKDILKSLGKNGFRIAMAILILIPVLTTINYLTGSWNAFFIDSYSMRKWYGFFIGSVFSGVIGVGFYPIMGSRVWCRFGCPMAAILGLQQKFFSRFRITTNGSQCISCGNCSTYCEMGIDVRAYAQKGQSIVRSSCVGCGICSAVCPRGVLRLENGTKDLFSKTSEMHTIHISENEVRILQ
jgi:polyferredoxin